MHFSNDPDCLLLSDNRVTLQDGGVLQELHSRCPDGQSDLSVSFFLFHKF